MHSIHLECFEGIEKMYFLPKMYPYPYYVNTSMNYYGGHPIYGTFPIGGEHVNRMYYCESSNGGNSIMLKDYGAEPFVVNIHEAAKQNNTYRTALWTGNHVQVTLMSLDVGENIGLEMHPHVDQFLRIEQGQGIVKMGKSKDILNSTSHVNADFAIIIPAGTWHDLTNTGNIPLKLYSIYAPPNHPFGTIHYTKADAIAMKEDLG